VVDWDDKKFEALAKAPPIGRAGKPEEIASMVLWLCIPGASYVVGHALAVGRWAGGG
jgi:NAD(P)-dependent dehydrogenase (short-subunit alcohol dehydrogenase family)